MRDWSFIGTALVVAWSTLSAQQTGTGMISGRAMDLTKYPLPGVTVTVTGAVRREAVTLSEGEYRISDLPPGRYIVMAELVGFLTEPQVVDLGAEQDRTINLSLRAGCIGEDSPPLIVHFPFDQMLPKTAGAAYVRIREVGNRERLLTDVSCISVRPYVAEALGFINVAPPQGDAGIFQFYGNSWDPPLAVGDEIITFLWREESGGSYLERDEEYRMPIRNGRLNWRRTDWSTVANGDPVEDVLKSLRTALGLRPAP